MKGLHMSFRTAGFRCRRSGTRFCSPSLLVCLFVALCVLYFAPSMVVADPIVVPNGDGGQPHGFIPRIGENTNICDVKTQSFSSSILTKAISLVVGYGLTYLVTELIFGGSDEQKQWKRATKEDEGNREASRVTKAAQIRLEHKEDSQGS